MKKAILITALVSLGFASSLLPNSFAGCVALNYFSANNAPLPLNDYMKIVKKYDCDNKILYIGIEDRIPGILKLKENKNSKDFLIDHFTVNGYEAAVYVDKHLNQGVIAIKLTDKYALKVLFNGSDYKSIIPSLKKLDLNKIKENLKESKSSS